MYACHAEMFTTDTADPVRIAEPDSQLRPRLVSTTGALTASEVQAVLIGRGDASRYGWDGSAPHSPLRRLARRVFARLTGIREVTLLADERLETLRLFACMMRRNDRRAEQVAEQLTLMGMSPGALYQAVGLALS